MRLLESRILNYPVEAVWGLVGDPANHARFFAGMRDIAPLVPGPQAPPKAGDGKPAPGARYRYHLDVGATAFGADTEIVTYRPPYDLSLVNVTGLDVRIRWWLRPVGSGAGVPLGSGAGVPLGSGAGVPLGSGAGVPLGSGAGVPLGSGAGVPLDPGAATEVRLRLAYAVPGGLAGMVSGQAAAVLVRRRLAETLRRLDAELAGTPVRPQPPRPGLLDRASAEVYGAFTLLRTGIIRPTRPDRTVRRARAVLRWGITPAAGYAAAAARCPRRPAVIDDFGSVTFEQVHQRSTRIAHGLAALGVAEGGRVALLCRNHRGFIEAITACSMLGAHALLLNTGMSAEQAATVLAQQQPAAVIADTEFEPMLAGVPRIAADPGYGGAGPSLDSLAAGPPAARIRPPGRAGRLIVLTSGTTGTPKGAFRPEPRSLEPVAAVLTRLPLRAEEATFVAPPLFHTLGLGFLQLAIPLRQTLVLQRRFDPEETLRALAGHRCTAMVAVPILLRRLLDLPAEVRQRYDTSPLRTVACSGSALPAALATAFMDAYGEVLYNIYGSTEVSWASIASPTDLRAAPGCVGHPPRGTRLAILDAGGVPVPPGTVGRIFVGHGSLFEGYTGGGPGKQVRYGLMSTGDLGHLDAAGRLWVSGRDDDMIVSGGENVYPGEVEEVLAGVPQIADAAVVGVPDEDFGQRLAAYVVLREPGSMSADDVRDLVRRRLARFSVPREVVFCQTLPRNATGKVVKRDLPAG
jgi:acyl-CoA synthetase (AMP-forming)/AMP-acid ligase II